VSVSSGAAVSGHKRLGAPQPPDGVTASSTRCQQVLRSSRLVSSVAADELILVGERDRDAPATIERAPAEATRPPSDARNITCLVVYVANEPTPRRYTLRRAARPASSGAWCGPGTVKASYWRLPARARSLASPRRSRRLSATPMIRRACRASEPWLAHAHFNAPRGGCLL